MSSSVKPDRFNVWDGIYPTFRDAPVEGLGFDDPEWRTRSISAARDARADVLAGRRLDYSMRQRNSVLAALSASLLARKPRIRILDFGGGPGFGFLVLQSAIPRAAERIDYHIVEVPGVCREATKVFEGQAAPTFHASLPDDAAFDIVFTASTIQYIEDWRAISDRLAAFGAPHLVLSDVYAGAFSAYTTLQQYYGSRIAHWMLNEDELVSHIQSGGYTLQLRSPCSVKILGVEGELPMTNFPAELRLESSHHLMFSRRDQ